MALEHESTRFSLFFFLYQDIRASTASLCRFRAKSNYRLDLEILPVHFILFFYLKINYVRAPRNQTIAPEIMSSGITLYDYYVRIWSTIAVPDNPNSFYSSWWHRSEPEIRISSKIFWEFQFRQISKCQTNHSTQTPFKEKFVFAFAATLIRKCLQQRPFVP